MVSVVLSCPTLGSRFGAGFQAVYTLQASWTTDDDRFCSSFLLLLWVASFSRTFLFSYFDRLRYSCARREMENDPNFSSPNSRSRPTKRWSRRKRRAAHRRAVRRTCERIETDTVGLYG